MLSFSDEALFYFYCFSGFCDRWEHFFDLPRDDESCMPGYGVGETSATCGMYIVWAKICYAARI